MVDDTASVVEPVGLQVNSGNAEELVQEHSGIVYRGTRAASGRAQRVATAGLSRDQGDISSLQLRSSQIKEILKMGEATNTCREDPPREKASHPSACLTTVSCHTTQPR